MTQPSTGRSRQLDDAFLSVGSSSFTEFVSAYRPELLPAGRRLPSGAGHDGMALIDIAPIGMLFVRCEGGISHNPAEAVTLEDVATGLRVFARFILAFTPPSRS